MTAARLTTFPREIGLKRRVCKSQDQFMEYVRRLIGKSSVYTSLYSFTKADSNKPWRMDYTSATIDKAWWDFDSGDKGGIEQSNKMWLNSSNGYVETYRWLLPEEVFMCTNSSGGQSQGTNGETI